MPMAGPAMTQTAPPLPSTGTDALAARHPAPAQAARQPGEPAAPAASAALPPRAPGGQVPVSATLAANEVLAARRQAGQPVLPMAFGEAGLPAHPVLSSALAAGAAAAGGNAYGPVAGQAGLREAAAGYWSRRGLPTSPDAVVAGPGSKSLLFGLLLALGTDVAMPRPSWVSYAAQAALIGATPHFVPTPPGEGGVCDPARLAHAVVKARAAGRRIGAVVVTLPDNPTGRLARPATVRALAEVAARYDLIIISDEIYRDLRYDCAPQFTSPASFLPDRTVVTTALSKSLALGGWRIGVARLPDGPAGAALRGRLLGIGSEIWSATTGPVQDAAALAFSEPPEVAERVTRSRSLHAAVAHAAAARFAGAGVDVPDPQAAFYLYPDFAPWREHLARKHSVTTSAQLAGLLLHRYGMGVLAASAFGEDDRALRLRVATGMLYGETSAQREQALTSPDPVGLPWVAAALGRLEEILADLAA
jgi:aspartate aminotransferase